MPQFFNNVSNIIKDSSYELYSQNLFNQKLLQYMNLKVIEKIYQ